MVNNTLDGVRAKIARAEEHFEDLHRAIQADLEVRKAAYDAWRESRAQGKDLPLEAPPAHWQLMIGDCLHNLRSSLDYLVGCLATFNDRPASACEDAAFPIHSVQDDTAKRAFATAVVPFLSKEAAALIESFQPYHGYEGMDADSLLRRDLRRLHTLENIERHRLLVVVEEWSEPVVLDFAPADVMEYFHPTQQPRSPDPQPPVPVTHELALDIAFADTDGLCDGCRVDAVLTDLKLAVVRVVDTFEEMFFR
jgi:hypothetical protein